MPSRPVERLVVLLQIPCKYRTLKTHRAHPCSQQVLDRHIGNLPPLRLVQISANGTRGALGGACADQLQVQTLQGQACQPGLPAGPDVLMSGTVAELQCTGSDDVTYFAGDWRYTHLMMVVIAPQ